MVFGSGDFWCLLSIHNAGSSLRQRSSAAKILCGSSFISCSVTLSLRPPPAKRLMEPALRRLACMPDHQCMMRGWFGHVSRHAVRYMAEMYLSKPAGLQASKPNRFCFVLCFLSSCMRRGSCTSDVFGARSWNIVCAC